MIRFISGLFLFVFISCSSGSEKKISSLIDDFSESKNNFEEFNYSDVIKALEGYKENLKLVKKCVDSVESEFVIEINNYKVFETIPSLIINKETLINIEPKIDHGSQDLVSFGVDSFELFKMWFEENFAELANKLVDANLAKKIYLIASPQNQRVVEKIINFSSKKIFFDCSRLNLLQVIKVIKYSNYFVGNNSGPLNLASALGVKAFGLIANDRVSELKNSNIIPILPSNYKNEINRDREGMKRLDVELVFNQIKNNLD